MRASRGTRSSCRSSSRRTRTPNPEPRTPNPERPPLAPRGAGQQKPDQAGVPASRARAWPGGRPVYTLLYSHTRPRRHQQSLREGTRAYLQSDRKGNKNYRPGESDTSCSVFSVSSPGYFSIRAKGSGGRGAGRGWPWRRNESPRAAPKNRGQTVIAAPAKLFH